MDPKTRTTQADIAQYLSVLPLFKQMTRDEHERLAEGCTLMRLERGAMIFRAGDPCEAFYISLTGQVKLYALAPNGQEKVIEIAGPGHSFGEAVMFLERPFIINAQVLTDALVLAVGKRAIFDEVDRDPRFARRMLAGIAARQHVLVRDVQAYTLHSGVQRVIGYLLRAAAPHALEFGSAMEPDDAGDAMPGPTTVSLPVAKATIASRLSMTPEYFSRVLHELETNGLIAVDGRDIRLLDPKGLAAYTPRGQGTVAS